MMKKLFTYCPNCRAGFYVGTEKREGEKVEVNCPRCQFRYGDTVEAVRTKEMKYNWELYENINIGLISNEGDPLQLKIAGISLFSTLVLFSIGIISLLILNSFTLVHRSLGIAGSVFAIFVVLGSINSYKKRSFVLAFTGSLFAIFSSFIWGYLNSQGNFLIFSQHVSLPYTVLGLFLSFLALILIIKNRLIFDFGY